MGTPSTVPLPLRMARRLGLLPGTFKRTSDAQPPSAPLELYSFEGCPACRRVRRTLTELDLDFVHRTCPIGDSENRRRLLTRGGKSQVPYLVDPNTGVEMYESRDIVRYLLKQYGG
jgi:glutaredoxin